MDDSRPGAAPDADVDALVGALRRRVDAQVMFEPGDRALYTTDASNYRQVPLGVVVPRSVEAIAEAVAVCREHGVPVLHRGGGTSLAGQTANTAVVIDSSKYCNRVLSIDAEACTARVEPGVVLDDLRDAAKPYGLTFGPDPSTHTHCTLGGMIGNNSAGVHSVSSGRTVDNIERLVVLTYDGTRLDLGATSDEEYARMAAAGGRQGEIVRALRALAEEHAAEIRTRFPGVPRRISGFNLDQLLPEKGFHLARALVGTEGTCVTVLEATVRLVPDPPCKVLLVAGFADIAAAADMVPEILPFAPLGLEAVDDRLVAYMRGKGMHTDDLARLPDGESWFLIQIGGQSAREAETKADALRRFLEAKDTVRGIVISRDEAQRQRFWEIRESGLGATAFVPGQKRDTWPGWEDSAVAPDRLGAYLRDLKALYAKYGYDAAMYGHFGDGLIHTRIDFGLHDRAQVERFRAFMEEGARLVVDHGGTLSGEHGDGQARGELLGIMYGERIVKAFETFKGIFDPDNRMNPGKVVHPRPLDVDLRLGPRFHPPELDTWFAYRDSESSFARATTRCVGVGKCRRIGSGTMCPSYPATRDERHTTRGRAHMLQEMLIGDPIADGWRSEPVREALSLCLSCKACKSECPVSVDMATYKAEFLAHHYAGRLRPRAFYTMGRIHRWARLAARMPRLVNAVAATPGLAQAARWVAGIDQSRPIPRLAPQSFRRAWQGGNEPTEGEGPLVVLWADSFNDFFTPGPLHGAAALLQDAGCRVLVPGESLCCGRPCYEFGWLDEARELLRAAMDWLEGPISQGAWLVGVEPSCLGTFRDELCNLFPDDPRAGAIAKRTRTLAGFLFDEIGYRPPALDGGAVLHGHCNHEALFGLDAEAALLRRAGLEVEVLDSGCCGMAGAFGFEAGKAEVSRRIFADRLGPAVADAGRRHVVADGYSCREQIRQESRRVAITLPELLARALDERRRGRV